MLFHFSCITFKIVSLTPEVLLSRTVLFFFSSQLQCPAWLFDVFLLRFRGALLNVVQETLHLEV